MATQNEKIVEALNGVSSRDSFQCPMDRIVRITSGDSQVIHPGKAIQILETRIGLQAVRLNEAKETLRSIRETALVGAKEAVMALGD